MKCIFVFLISISLFSPLCWATKSNQKPLFDCLLKKEKKKNKKQKVNLKTTIRETVDLSHLKEPSLPEEDSLLKDLMPTLNDDFSSRVKELQKKVSNDRILFQNENSANPLQTQNELNKFKEDFIRHYLEKQVLEKNIINRAKKKSSAVSNITQTVESVASATKIESAKDEDFQFGTNADILRQNARIWMDSYLFNSKAEVNYHGFNKARVNISVFRQFDLSDVSFIPLNNLYSSMNYEGDNEDLSSTISTKFTPNLEFSYKNVISEKVNSFSFQYNINF